MEQYFKNISVKTDYPTINSDIKCDIAIIGGGLAGIMCAHALKDMGVDICIFEADMISGGESKNSSAIITYAHDLIYRKLTKKHGINVAKEYLEQNKGAQEYIEKLSNDIDCEYRHCDLIYFATTESGKKHIQQEMNIYNKLGLNCKHAERCELPFPVAATMTIPSQGCLNPYMFITNLCATFKNCNIKVYEHSRVTTVPEKNKITVNNHTVEAKYFVIATHFPYINTPGYYFTKMYQSRSYSGVYNTNLRLNNMYESAEDNGFEYRPTDDGTLCCGCGVRTGKNKSVNYYTTIDNHMTEKFATGENDNIAHFSAQDCITLDELPMIGVYAKSMPNVFLASGFNKWGFTTSAVAGKIIANLIDGKETNNIFAPNRLYALKSPIKELQNIAIDIAGFGNNLIGSKSMADLQIGKGKIIKHNGERLGVFRRDDGGIDAIVATCPHLGCALMWNSTDNTWDCPCHGSRFDTKGNIISNPTVKNAEQRKL